MELPEAPTAPLGTRSGAQALGLSPLPGVRVLRAGGCPCGQMCARQGLARSGERQRGVTHSTPRGFHLSYPRSHPPHRTSRPGACTACCCTGTRPGGTCELRQHGAGGDTSASAAWLPKHRSRAATPISSIAGGSPGLGYVPVRALGPGRVVLTHAQGKTPTHSRDTGDTRAWGKNDQP